MRDPVLLLIDKLSALELALDGAMSRGHAGLVDLLQHRIAACWAELAPRRATTLQGNAAKLRLICDYLDAMGAQDLTRRIDRIAADFGEGRRTPAHIRALNAALRSAARKAAGSPYLLEDGRSELSALLASAQAGASGPLLVSTQGGSHERR